MSDSSSMTTTAAPLNSLRATAMNNIQNLPSSPMTRENGVPHAPIHFSASIPINPQFIPGGRRSLCAISSRAFGLGIAFGISSMLAAMLAHLDYYIWRAPFFIATLSIFHYLEFDMTARYNPPDATVSSFLLTSNGSAYNIAHAAAVIEVLVRCLIQSSLKPDWLRLPFNVSVPYSFQKIPPAFFIYVGFFCTILGQYVRSAAMKTAGTSFNHLVQSTKKDNHVLITKGIYAWSRHPSYFGFFWWGLGTQMVLGNGICLVAYAIILWHFFAARIVKEEQFLVLFFGADYERYRERTGVGIPFIR